MEEKDALLEQFLNCHVCSEIFRDPVSLSCSHSFCSSCLQKFWEQAKNNNCPICKRKSSNHSPGVNFALKELADSFAGRQKARLSETLKEKKMVELVCSKCQEETKLFCVDEQRAVCPVCEFSLHQSHKVVPMGKRKSSKDEPSINFPLEERDDSFAKRQSDSSPKIAKEEQKEKEEVVCDKHPEALYWFCKDEDRAVCPVCEFSLHQSHKVVPVEEAVSDLKEQLKSDLKSLQDKRNKYKQVEETYNEMSEHSKKQLLSTERQIRAEFNKLHQFLREEEESRLAALREEEEQKGRTMNREMKMIEEQISSLSDSISAVEEELQKHSVPFLSSYKATQSRARAQSSVSDPQLVSGTLIDVAKHLGNLSFRVWEKMKEKVHFSPVILDPNTANPCLYLSDDLTSVRDGDTKQLPDNPERNTNYRIVFGSEGFSSGKHSWEVEVGDHPSYFVGLAKESVDRKGVCLASPEYGFWCLLHCSGKYTNGLGQTVTVKKSLQRIRVQLDYDRGEVSFYDPEDMTQIYTHRDTFTEKLFPYFSVGQAAVAKTSDIKICKTEISLKT